MRSTKITLSLALALGLAGCKSNPPAQPAAAPIVDMNNGADPAAANMAPVDSNAAAPTYAASTPAPGGRVLGQRSEVPQTAPSGEQYPEQTQPANDDAYDQYDSQVNAGQDALYADQAPPPLPVYDQPQLTQANDQWTPGYWNYNNSGYYFVPGAWVAPPYSGALWTPGYWGYEGRRYRFHRGFWGRHIGFYGGIDYGFGYTGRGYEGGYWNNNNFFYNQRVNRVNAVDVRNVYVRNVTVVNDNHYSFNGPGGYQARPVPAELAVYHEQRLPPQQVQIQVREQAASNRQQFFAENHGRPAIAVAPQRFAADAQPGRPIEPIQRGGFGQPGVNPQAQQQQVRAQQLQQQQLRTQQAQQQTAQQQQHNAQVQQQEQQRTQQLQQRNVQQQQRAQQLQQRDTQNAQQQQRVQAEQEHNTAVQQQNAQRQQQVQAQQQRTQQNAAAQQQRAAQEQQRATQEQQHTQQVQAQQQQRQAQQQAQQQQREARPTPQAQPQRPAPQATPAPHPQPAARPAAPAPHPAEASHGGERPHR